MNNNLCILKEANFTLIISDNTAQTKKQYLPSRIQFLLRLIHLEGLHMLSQKSSLFFAT